MVHCDLNLLNCTSALNILTECILIAQFSRKKRKTSEINNSTKHVYDPNTIITNNTLTINHIQFMNTTLLSKLGFNSKDSYSRAQQEASVVLLLVIEEKNYCSIFLTNANNEKQQFYGICSINYDENVCIVKLQEQELEDHMYLDKFFNSIGMYMTIIELGPDNEKYEWRHVNPNAVVRRFYNAPYEKISSFTASERNTLRERKHFYAACMDSKLYGIDTPKIADITDTYIPLLGTVITYLGIHPVTKRDLFACAIRDPKKVYASEGRIRELIDFFEYAPMLMGAIKLDKEELTTLYVNKAVAQLCDIPQKEFNSMDFSKIKIFSGEIMTTFVQHIMEARENKDRPIEFQIFVPDHAGNDHYFTVTISTITYEKDKSLSTHVFNMLDVTTQKDAENTLKAHKESLEATVHMRTIELHEKELRFRSLVANVPNIILSVDAKGIIEYANRHFVSDQPEASLVGKCLPALIAEGSSLMEKISSLFETNKPFITEVKLLDADIWLNISAGLTSEVKSIIVATDITENKKMSEELNHALSTKSRFLANMSHEVRTPLSGIIGMSRILMESSLSLDQIDCVATIQNCGETLLAVINDVLDYTKLEAAGMTLEYAELSFLQCIEESLFTVVPIAHKKKLELIVDIDPNIPVQIIGDSLRLRQVILNLLTNAVKFTDSGYVMVSLVGNEVMGTDEWEFRCTIKDTGCGVPPESQAKLFQMFSQVDISTTRKYGGTGIGLALAKRFLEMMNGNITMESSGIPGLGSTFTFNLVATVSPFTPVTVQFTSSLPGLMTSTQIFIIDDVDVSCEVLKKRLMSHGFISIQIHSNLEVALREISACQQQDNKDIIVFCNVDKLVAPVDPMLLHPHVATILMGYIKPPNFETDFPKFEYLRKPIKQSAFVRCLREIWNRFFDLSKSAAHPTTRTTPIRAPSPNLTFLSTPVSPVLPTTSPLSILVVEDNEMNQKVVRRVFQHLQFPNIKIANHGQEALDIIQNDGVPDLILMDVQMPVLDGVETTKIIRKKFAMDAWPYIVSMTADVFPEDRKNCLEAGMNDFLTKPIRMEQVQATLQKCIKLKEARTASNLMYF